MADPDVHDWADCTVRAAFRLALAEIERLEKLVPGMYYGVPRDPLERIAKSLESVDETLIEILKRLPSAG